MYEQDFGLRCRPFRATPDRSAYYPATCHETALAQLVRAINEDEGFALLTGAPGTGKTLLCHCLLERLGADTASALLTNSHFPDRLSLLQAILYDFSLPYEDGGEQLLRLRLTDFLLKNCAAGRRAVLLADEAQHLSADLLEELRLLGNLEAGQGKALQIILVGQPELLKTLARPELAACQQRLVVRARLEALGLEEGVDYLLHHLRAAGGKAETLVEDPALEILARGAGGIPRVLNQVAHQALLLAHAAEMNRVDAEAALEALSSLGREAETQGPEETSGEAEEAPANLALTSTANRVLGLMDGDQTDNPVRLFDSPRPA